MASQNLYLSADTFDLVLDSNYQIRMTQTEAEYISQKIEGRLGLQRGEWFLNRDLGIPYYEEILKKNPDLNKVRNLFTSEILRIPEIKTLLEFNIDFDQKARKYTLSFIAELTSGAIVDSTATANQP